METRGAERYGATPLTMLGLVTAVLCSAAPIVSAEVPLDAPVSAPAAAGDQGIAVDFDGTNYFALWANRFGLFAGRVSPQGVGLDGAGVQLAAGDFSGVPVAVAFDGAQHLAVWVRAANPLALVLAPSGQPASPAPFSLDTAATAYRLPRVAGGGAGGWLATWTSSTSLVKARRVAADGGVQGAVISLQDPTTSDGVSGGVAFDGANYFVVFTNQVGVTPTFTNISGARITAAGAVLDTPPLQISRTNLDEHAPSVAFDGTRYLVAWSEGVVSASTDLDAGISARRVNTDGTLLDPTPLHISATPGEAALPVVTFDGTQWWVTWFDFRGSLRAQRVTSAGALRDGPGLQVSAAHPGGTDPLFGAAGAVFNYGAVGSPSGLFTLWAQSESGWATAAAARVSPAGSVLDAQPLAPLTGTDSHSDVTVAAGPGQSLVLWVDHQLHGALTARVLSPRGDFAGPPRVLSAQARDALQAGAAYDGQAYVVAWAEADAPFDAGVKLARLDPTGAVLGGGPLTLGSAGPAGFVSVLPLGAGTVVLWTAASGVLAVRLDAAGAVLDPTPIQVTASGSSFRFAAASTGREVLLRTVTCSFGYGCNDSALLRSNGTVSPGPFSACGTTCGFQAFSIASDGVGFLSTEAFAGRGLTLSYVFPDGGGRFDGGPAISLNGTPSTAASFDGTNYLVGWTDGDGSHAMRVTPGGAVLDPSGVPFFSDGGDRGLQLSLRTDGGGGAAVYLRDDPALHASRGYARLIGALGLGQSCAGPTDCGSGHCEASVCCDRTCAGACTTGYCGAGGGSAGSGGGGATAGSGGSTASSGGGGGGGGGAAAGSGGAPTGGGGGSASPSFAVGCGCGALPAQLLALAAALALRSVRRGRSHGRPRIGSSPDTSPGRASR